LVLKTARQRTYKSLFGLKKALSGSLICIKQNLKLPKLKNHFKESNLTLIPWLHQCVDKEAGVH
jgi:hypothetical protein